MLDVPYGYCGMPCALCSRYRTQGTSRCLGCSQDGYYTQTCKVHHCCKEKGLAHCGLCSDYPCKPLKNAADFKDLNTNHVKARTGAAVAADGFDAWYAELQAKAELLTVALERYNNGRMKRYLCELFIQQELLVLKRIMARAEGLEGSPQENGKAFQALVSSVLEAGGGAAH